MDWDYYVPLLETLHRLKLMSSPSLSDLGRSERSALDDRNNQQHRAGANATWNSIHNAVIAVFQRRDLGENELYVLNEGVSYRPWCERAFTVENSSF
uniref:Proline rich 5b (renal) n=1 Tax=Cyprinus carpio carpio TaxID=630221 RepID=A0A9J8CTY8_CYPCA